MVTVTTMTTTTMEKKMEGDGYFVIGPGSLYRENAGRCAKCEAESKPGSTLKPPKVHQSQGITWLVVGGI